MNKMVLIFNKKLNLKASKACLNYILHGNDYTNRASILRAHSILTCQVTSAALPGGNADEDVTNN